MLDTSYGFNNLLKEVPLSPSRDTNTSPDLKKSSSKTSTPARKSVPKSSAPTAPSVNPPFTPKSFLYLLLSSCWLQGR